jgi:hypothetical protein
MDKNHSPSPISSSNDSYLKLCDTPQNSPAEGNSRPLSPTLMKEDVEKEQETSSGKTLKSKEYEYMCPHLYIR